MPGIDAVLFDLDETLLDDDASMRRALAETCSELEGEYGLPAERLARVYLEFAPRAWRGLGSVPTAGGARPADGRAIRAWMWGEVLGLLGVAAPAAAERAAGLYAAARRRSYAAFDDALPVLERLSAEHRLGVVTNGASDTQRDKLGALGLGRFFGAVVISGEAGVGKPEPAVFRLALEALAVAPARAAHVGDSLESDVAGASRAGMHAVWLSRAGDAPPAGGPRPGASIHTLAELPGVLRRLAAGASPAP